MTATSQFSALSHPQRLAVFRLLVRHLPQAVSAGEIARALDLKPNTTSVYLSALRNAALVSQRRQGTSLLYRANLQSAEDLVQYLFSDCCRDRLALSAPEDGMRGTDNKLNILFACTGNSARSICAEALVRDRLPMRFNAFSAGTDPAKAPNPSMLRVLRAQGHTVDLLHSKPISLFHAEDAPKMDIVITLCDMAAHGDCPSWVGHPVSAHWGLLDPVKAATQQQNEAGAFHTTYDQLACKVDQLAKIDFADLPRAEIQSEIDRIGTHSNGQTI